MNNLGLNNKESKNLSYQEMSDLLKKNQSLGLCICSIRWIIFLRNHTWRSIRKTKYYAIRIEFQESGSPYTYSIIWIFNASNIENEDAYIEFIKKSINAQTIWMIRSFSNLLSPTKLKLTEELAENTTIMNFDYPMVDIFVRR